MRGLCGHWNYDFLYGLNIMPSKSFIEDLKTCFAGQAGNEGWGQKAGDKHGRMRWQLRNIVEKYFGKYDWEKLWRNCVANAEGRQTRWQGRRESKQIYKIWEFQNNVKGKDHRTITINIGVWNIILDTKYTERGHLNIAFVLTFQKGVQRKRQKPVIMGRGGGVHQSGGQSKGGDRGHLTFPSDKHIAMSRKWGEKY